MKVNFSKMHGLGNDFVVIESITQFFLLLPEKIRELSDRHRGIGFDQLLLIEKPRSPDTEFFYRIFNADGSEVEQCGNGARCIAKFLQVKGFTHQKTIKIGTVKADILLQLMDNDLVKVEMSTPKISSLNEKIEAKQQLYDCSIIDMGNPHCIILVDDIERFPVQEVGAIIAQHPRFPRGINAGFAQILNKQNIKLRVVERGVGETLACGSGACAAAVAVIAQGLTDYSLDVHLRGGLLKITWEGKDQPVIMTGPAVFVYDGYFLNPQ